MSDEEIEKLILRVKRSMKRTMKRSKKRQMRPVAEKAAERGLVRIPIRQYTLTDAKSPPPPTPEVQELIDRMIKEYFDEQEEKPTAPD